MTIERVRVRDVLVPDRLPVTPTPEGEYVSIGVRSFGKGIFHYEPKRGAQLGKLRFHAVPPDRLVISNIKGWEGAIAVSGPGDAHTIASNRFLVYRARDERIDINWAKWYFLSEAGLPKIQHASPGSADRNRTLAIERFENLEIPLPSFDEQRRVAARLDRISRGRVGLDAMEIERSVIAGAVPLAVLSELERRVRLRSLRLVEALRPVRHPVTIDPVSTYVTIGIRSFGKGIFHYPRRPGSEIGKLRFHEAPPGVLAVSNIKGWEGAVATTSAADSLAVASNRFLFFEPVAGPAAADYFWAKLLTSEGLHALGQASPGSADRNRTLALDRFLKIEMPLPDGPTQTAIGRKIRVTREMLAGHAERASIMAVRVDALLPSALNEAFANLT